MSYENGAAGSPCSVEFQEPIQATTTEGGNDDADNIHSDLAEIRSRGDGQIEDEGASNVDADENDDMYDQFIANGCGNETTRGREPHRGNDDSTRSGGNC